MDLQSTGIQISNYRKQIAQLKARVVDLEIERDSLRLVIEEILLSPGSYEHYTGNKSHPMNDKS